jgi:Tctex-1 family
LGGSHTGLAYETVAFWDAATDGVITVKYENDTIVCITTIIGVAL